MKKVLKKQLKMMIAVLVLIGSICMSVNTLQVKATAVNGTMDTATVLGLDKVVEEDMNGGKMNDDIRWYKFTVPAEYQNQWLTVSVNSVEDGFNMLVYDSLGGKLSSFAVGENKPCLKRFKIEGGDSRDKTRLSVNETYYLKISPYKKIEGRVSVKISLLNDDNWGSYEKAQRIEINKEISGKLEEKDDLDSYVITLPKDGCKYSFVLRSTGGSSIMEITDSNKAKLSTRHISANSTNSLYSLNGEGQRIFIRVYGDDAVTYNIKIVKKLQKISVLKLTNYRRGNKKIVGKTIGKASVKVTINKKTYKVKSNKNGSFTVKLKKKLKQKDKIKVTVSLKGYKSKTAEFKVK